MSETEDAYNQRVDDLTDGLTAPLTALAEALAKDHGIPLATAGDAIFMAASRLAAELTGDFDAEDARLLAAEALGEDYTVVEYSAAPIH